MKKIDINSIRTIQIQILDEINRFCTDKGITYYLCGGSLLGAIRHKGYIPWDDDIDIMMPREDYERFIKLYTEENKSFYKLINYRNTKNYIYPFTKIIDDRTLLYEDKFTTDAFGIYVDIFPLDYMPSNPEEHNNIINKIKKMKEVVAHKERTLRKISWKAKGGFIKGIIYNLYTLLFRLLYANKRLSCILREMDKTSISGNNSDRKYIGNFVWGYHQKELCPVEAFASKVYVDFEGKKYPSPIDYDRYLRGLYGDYMQLPPVEKRCTCHSIDAYWK